jgi:hypothetical protein
LLLWARRKPRPQVRLSLKRIAGQKVCEPQACLTLKYMGQTSTAVCLHAGNVEFSTSSEVRMSMRVTKCINLLDYFPIYHEQFQYADNNNILFNAQFTT